MSFKKCLSGFILAALLVSLNSTAFAASGTPLGAEEIPSNDLTSAFITSAPVTTEATSFQDVSGHWAAEHIEAATALGLFSEDTEFFYPEETMTRAQCISILWKMSGSPKPNAAATFTDIDQEWYRDAVAWAQGCNLVNGVGNNLFDPYGLVTREQMATLLHRMAGSPIGMEMMFSKVYDYTFSDSDQISSWAKSSVYWSVFNVIYCGNNSSELSAELNPTQAASRAQIAVMITRYLGTT